MIAIDMCNVICSIEFLGAINAALAKLLNSIGDFLCVPNKAWF